MNDISHGLVLNHLSLPFTDTNTAEQGVLTFLGILQACRKYGLKILLIDQDQDRSLMALELCSGYCIRDWFGRAKRNTKLKDWCTFLRSIATRQPLFEKADINAIDAGVEVGLQGVVNGNDVLLAAYHFQAFLVSFATLDTWCKPYLQIWIYDIRSGTETQQFQQLPNLVDASSLQQHEPQLRQRRDQLFSSAKVLWQNREELFPNLTLLQNQIGSALQNWSGRSDILTKARDAMAVLELFAEKLKNGEYVDYRHDYLLALGLSAEVSAESSSVYNDRRLHQQRLFWLDDGRQIYCANHVKLPSGFRLYFYPDVANKHVYICYLGSHLETKKF